ncbi:MAG: hypothetical protein K6U04_03740 [Armatimonadetes bacterium]|nr:hypothetical protein [Armatimonadota bacterium]
MSSFLYSGFFQLPSVRRFLASIVDDLANRRSVLLLLPLNIEPAQVMTVLREELWRRDISSVTLPLPEFFPDRPPPAALGEALGVDWGEGNISRTVANLIVASSSLPDLIWLDGYCILPEIKRKIWLEFLVQWSWHSQNTADYGVMAPAICLVIPANMLPCEVPTSSLYLSVRWWWGFPTALEMQLLCRINNELEQEKWGASSLWREFLLPALVGNDIACMAYLWNEVDGDLEKIVQSLQAYSYQCGWTWENLVGQGFEFQNLNERGVRFGLPGAPSVAPPLKLFRLWSHGLLMATPEYGIELHSAALNFLGKKEELWHRIWRGQAALLLPVLDDVRLTICNLLTRRYGHNWPIRWFPPLSEEEKQAVRDNPLACQWGHLEYLLKYCHSLQPERRWLSLVTTGRKIRNELAHYRPINYSEFRTFYGEMYNGVKPA